MNCHLCAALALRVALAAAALAAGTGARGGAIRATLEAEEPVVSVWAIGRVAGQLTTSKGKTHDTGMYGRAYQGRVEGEKVIIEGLPVPGRYDLKLETGSGGVIAGWDAGVPESDYVGEPPLEEESRKLIFKKLGDDDFSAFSDRMWVMDIQGNIQNASVLLAKLRTRPFVGGAYKAGEWVWRVERWQWENPDEHTWVPYRKRPFYALIRERLYRRDYEAKKMVFSRVLGGIALTAERPEAHLASVRVPRPGKGVCAVDPEGERIEPVFVKGKQ